MTDDQHQIMLRQKLLTEIRRLRDVCKALEADRDEWKSRWEAERADHVSTIRHTNKMLAEDYP
jgi:hypothetical protein